MRAKGEETGELRIILHDLSLNSLFVRRGSRYVILSGAEGERRLEGAGIGNPARWVEAWHQDHPFVQIKEWVYVNRMMPVPSYGPKERRRKRRRKRR